MSAALADVEGATVPIPRIADPGPEAFLRDYLPTGQPVVLEGAGKDWACMKWSPDWFAAHYGDEPIRLLQMAPEEIEDGKYYAPTETTLGDAMRRLEEGNRAYCRFLPILMERPELQGDLRMDWFRARRGPWSNAGNLHLFIGGAKTATATHAAVSANLFMQIHGVKRWKIYSPEWSPVFKPPMERSMYFTSTFDPDEPDFDAYPEARHLRGYDIELHPGDVLFNPPFWWHKVSNPTVSVGIGFRWFPPGLCYRASPTQWLLTYLSINPPFWVGARYKLDFTRIFSARWSG